MKRKLHRADFNRHKSRMRTGRSTKNFLAYPGGYTDRNC